MYLWRIKNLKEDLKAKEVSPKDKLFYLLLFIILYFTLFVQGIMQISLFWNKEMIFLQVFISILGLVYAYYKNADATTFVQNFTAIGLVFVLRSLFFMTLGMTNLYVMTHLFGMAELFSPKNAIMVGMVFELLLYWRIGSHLASLKA